MKIWESNCPISYFLEFHSIGRKLKTNASLNFLLDTKAAKFGIQFLYNGYYQTIWYGPTTYFKMADFKYNMAANLKSFKQTWCKKKNHVLRICEKNRLEVRFFAIKFLSFLYINGVSIICDASKIKIESSMDLYFHWTLFVF